MCDSIANSYVDFTLNTWKANILDGYSSSTIKNITHRQCNTKRSRNVTLSPGMKFAGQKEHLLVNENNKAFISLVSEIPKKNGYTAYIADGDADVNIVCTAVSSENTTTTVIEEDNDLLILFLYHAKASGFKLYYCSNKRQTMS